MGIIDEQVVESFGDFRLDNQAKKVIILLDESKESKNALAEALHRNLLSSSDDITLLHCRPQSAFNPMISFDYELADIESPYMLAKEAEGPLLASLERASADLLRKASRLIEKSGKYRSVKAISLCAHSARDELLLKISKLGPDLIVMGGRKISNTVTGKVQDFLIGSVSTFISHKASVPFVIIRPSS